jgi:RNA-directed DNA polymerase
MSDGVLELPTSGTPQGGVISPLLSNIALNGIETHLKQWIVTCELKSDSGSNRSTQSKITSLTLVRYADDFVVLHKDRWVIVQIVEKWLSHLGLELKGSKTRLGHTDKYDLNEAPGFDFIGFHIRKYSIGKHHRGKLGLKTKTIIVPSKLSVKLHLRTVKLKLKASPNAETAVSNLNPIIRGWGNDYKTVTSSQTFSNCRKRLYDMLIAWGLRKHSTRTKAWVSNKYFMKKAKPRVEYLLLNARAN